jgi:Carboxypeptidase regulatory-like domain/TonB dependent receptor
MNRIASFLRLLCVPLGGLLLPSLVQAQVASVTGLIQDPSGATMPNVTVKADNTATGQTRSAETNDAGFYRLADLVPGVYVVTMQKTGFRTVRFENTTLTVDQILTLDATMQVSSAAQTVEVNESSVAPVDTETPMLSNVVDKQHIADLPLILRDPYQLVLLGPGVIQSNSLLGGFSVNGANQRQNNFLLDGVDNNDTDVPGIAGGIVSLSPDSTQEFRVITNNFAPEYGRNNGAIVDIITPSGANTLHGDAYWSGRYSALGARDFFNHQPNTPKDPYVRNAYGGSVSGHIIKDRTFWFANFDGNRFVTIRTNTSLVPTTAFKTGLFTYTNPGTGASQTIDVRAPSSPNNGLGLPLDPTLQKILALYPAPSAPTGDGITGNLFYPSQSRLSSDNFLVKVDHRLTTNNNLSVRYIFNRSTDPDPFHDDFLPGNLGATSSYQRTQAASISLVSTPRPTLINEFRFGANRTNLPFNCTGVGTFDSFGAKDPVGRGSDFTLPTIAGFGCQILGDTNRQVRFTGTYQTVDNVTWVLHQHTTKWGAEFRDVYANSFDDFSSRTAFDFSAFSNFGIAATTGVNPNVDSSTLENLVGTLFGNADIQSQNQFFNVARTRTKDDLRGFRQREWAAFIQDSWKARSNLTLTYGLRWERYGVPFEVNNNFSNLFRDASGPAPFTFTVVGPKTGGQLYQDELHNFLPRVGFAWDPFKSGKTSVRGGFGLFTDRVFGNLFGNVRANPPFQQAPTNFLVGPVTGLPALSTVKTSATIQNGAAFIPAIFDPNLRNPISANWNLGIGRQLRSSLTLEVNYVGTSGWRELRLVDGNPPQPALVKQLEAFCVPTNPANKGFFTLTGQCDQSTLQFTNLWFGFSAPGSPFNSIPFNAVNNNAFNSANLVKSIANSKYHGLQLKVTEQMFRGLQIQGSYTYAHAIDDAQDALSDGVAAGNRSFPRNSFNLRAERGNSDFDVRHRGVINFIYQPDIGRGGTRWSSGLVGRVFEGWELTGIATFQTGLPYDIFTTRDSQHTGVSDRATVIATPPPASTLPTDKRTLTGPTQFTFADGAFGVPSNLGRNHFFGPGINNWNMGLGKKTALTEKVSFSLRAEFYNLFNRVQFGQPGNNIDAPNFLVSTSQIGQNDGTTGARQIQFSAGMSF